MGNKDGAGMIYAQSHFYPPLLGIGGTMIDIHQP